MRRGFHVVMTGRTKEDESMCHAVAAHAHASLGQQLQFLEEERGVDSSKRNIPEAASADFLPLDLSSERSVDEFWRAFSNQYGNDAGFTLINNACHSAHGWGQDVFDDCMGVNVRGTARLTNAVLSAHNAPRRVLFMACRFARPTLESVGPRYVKDLEWCASLPPQKCLRELEKLVKVREGEDRLESTGCGAYLLSKACQLAFAQSVAREARRRGHHVNATCPGMMNTRTGALLGAGERGMEGPALTTVQFVGLDKIPSVLAQVYYVTKGRGSSGITRAERYPHGYFFADAEFFDIESTKSFIGSAGASHPGYRTFMPNSGSSSSTSPSWLDRVRGWFKGG
eukprot:Hpha_TRINITY_DN28410_c0_g1::TRINITY_DN28410_c0_g1_i1::g.183999::m.183999